MSSTTSSIYFMSLPLLLLHLIVLDVQMEGSHSSPGSVPRITQSNFIGYPLTPTMSTESFFFMTTWDFYSLLELSSAPPHRMRSDYRTSCSTRAWRRTASRGIPTSASSARAPAAPSDEVESPLNLSLCRATSHRGAALLPAPRTRSARVLYTFSCCATAGCGRCIL